MLTTAVPPEAREAWYERQLKAGMQVCIAHPKLVATGLDILSMATILFYEAGSNPAAHSNIWRPEIAIRCLFD